MSDDQARQFRSFRRSATERNSDPQIRLAVDIYSMVAGASVTDIVSVSDGAFIVRLSEGRNLVFAGLEGQSFRFYVDNRDAWQMPLPIVLERPASHGLGDMVFALAAVSSLFSMVYLIQAKREDELYAEFEADSDAYPVQSSLSNEQLTVASVGRGSWYVELIPKTKEAFQALFLIATSASDRGRDLLWRRLEAETKVRGSEADLAEITVERRRVTILRQRAVAIREQVRKATSLTEFYRKRLSKLPSDDPIRRRFEADLQYISGERGRLTGSEP